MLRYDGAKTATLKLPFGVQLPASCSVSVVGALRLLTFDTSAMNGYHQRRVAVACAPALTGALLSCGAGSLSLELCWNVPVYWEVRSNLGTARDATTAHQLAACLTYCAQEAGSRVQVSFTDALNGLRVVIARR